VLHVPNDIRAAFVGPAAMGAATFMFVGWVFGLSPSFFHDELNVHVTRPLASGLFAALVAFATGASQLALRHRIGRRPAAQALTAVVVGMAMIAASSISGYLPLAILGGIVAGLGAGLAQLNAMAAIQRIAPLHARSSVMSTYVTLCYVALCLPVIIAGQAADRFGLATVTTGYAGVPVRLSSSRCGSHERDRWPRSREETVVLRQSSEPESADSRRARSRHHRRCVAHPDDEAYLSAGLMAAAVDAGNHVVCVTATRGERGTSDPTRWPPSRLVDVRERELQASLASVGVDDHIWLPYFDGSCDTADPFVATKMIVTVLDDVGADTVVTFGPDGMTDHPDHIAVGKWATWAARGARRPPRVLSATKTTGWRDKYAVLHSRTPVFGPDGPPAVESVQLALALELRGPALDRKIAALTAHASQTAGLVRLMGAATYRAWAADEYFAHAAQAGCR
jgi:LmbE family N-acetylglucosaminyl deacetylase